MDLVATLSLFLVGLEQVEISAQHNQARIQCLFQELKNERIAGSAPKYEVNTEPERSEGQEVFLGGMLRNSGGQVAACNGPKEEDKRIGLGNPYRGRHLRWRAVGRRKVERIFC